MRHFAFLLSAYLAFALQAAVSSRLAVGGVQPLFLPLLLAWTCRRSCDRESIVRAASIGLLHDCLSPGRLGVGMLCGVIVVLVAQPLTAEKSGRSLSWTLVSSGAVTFSFLVLETAIRLMLSPAAGLPAAAPGLLIATSVFSAFVAFALHMLGRVAGRRLRRRGGIFQPSQS